MKSKIKRFKIKTNLKPRGDQPQAIKALTKNIREGKKHQVLLGVTGSGKTFTMAHTIMELNLPALILAPNKTLAAQLYSEFKGLFPKNAVEYFISYYDYYQPEAYLPSKDIYIEKDASINQQIDRMRHSATHALLERKDVIIVSSVSCIYGLGSPEAYLKMTFSLKINQSLNRDAFLRVLLQMHYKRVEHDFERGGFRVRGDVIEIYPPYEDFKVIRVEFFGNYVEGLFKVDPLSGTIFEEFEKISIYPGSHYVSSDEVLKRAICSIEDELRERILEFEKKLSFEKMERIKERTLHDLELLQEVGFCPGVENYSRHLTGRKPGEPPPTLLEYFPKKFLMFIDESHITVPQVGGMYRGDRSRKETLVEHAFRLPSALDNRPLNFKEFESYLDKVIYVSATPGDYEIRKSKNSVVEQIIRPTGLLDPAIEVRKASQQVKNLLKDIKVCRSKKERILITTLTKKSAEDLTEYYESLGIKIKYLHSDIHTLERSEIVRDLRLGKFDVLVGINLLREGLDIPEVSLVAILDADKEGFLRSERSLIQTIGRAARNVSGRVIIYADHMTRSIEKAILKTKMRRKKQDLYNKKHKIIPKSISKSSNLSVLEVFEGSLSIKSDDDSGSQHKNQTLLDVRKELLKDFKTNQMKVSEMKKVDQKIILKIKDLKEKMKYASEKLEFEKAAKFRDEIKGLEMLQLTIF